MSDNNKIVKFTGYFIVGADKTENDVLDALEAAAYHVDGILKHPAADIRDTDWEYGDDNHPLNELDAPVELCEKYFE